MTDISNRNDRKGSLGVGGALEKAEPLPALPLIDNSTLLFTAECNRFICQPYGLSSLLAGSPVAPIGATLFVRFTRCSLGQTTTVSCIRTMWVVAVDQSITIIVNAVGAICLRRWRCSAVLRAIALIFISFTDTVPAYNRRATIHLAVDAVFGPFAGPIAAAIV